ncbi:MAG: hypothetical protein AB8B57_16290 [Congregibacter sp.]
MTRLLVSIFVAALLTGCIGELPEAEYPCLAAQELFDTYNEAYVFAPGGNKEPVVERAQLAEADCRQQTAPDSDESSPENLLDVTPGVKEGEQGINPDPKARDERTQIETLR